MTKLDDLIQQGYKIQISEYVSSLPDSYFAYTDPENDWAREEHRTLVFHPLNYSYIAYENPLTAHDANMGYIYSQIEKRAEEALERLDKLVDDFNDLHEPKTLLFLPNVEVIENPDGTFSMSAKSVGFMRSDEFLIPFKEEADD